MNEGKFLIDLEETFIKIAELKNERMQERKEWRKFGKGINAENIRALDYKIADYERRARAFKSYADKHGFKIPEKYNFTYFSIYDFTPLSEGAKNT